MQTGGARKLNSSFRIERSLISRVARAAGRNQRKNAIIENAVIRLAADPIRANAHLASFKDVEAPIPLGVNRGLKKLVNFDLSADAANKLEGLRLNYRCSQTNVIEAAIEAFVPTMLDPESPVSRFRAAIFPPLKVPRIERWSLSTVAATLVPFTETQQPVLLDSSAIIAAMVSRDGVFPLSPQCAELMERCAQQQITAMVTPFALERVRLSLVAQLLGDHQRPAALGSYSNAAVERLRGIVAGPVIIAPLTGGSLAQGVSAFPALGDHLSWEVAAVARACGSNFYIVACDRKYDAIHGHRLDLGGTITVLRPTDLAL